MFKKILFLNLALISGNILCLEEETTSQKEQRACTAEEIYAVLTMGFQHGCANKSENALIKKLPELIAACTAGRDNKDFREDLYINPALAKCAHEFGQGNHHTLKEAIRISRGE